MQRASLWKQSAAIVAVSGGPPLATSKGTRKGRQNMGTQKYVLIVLTAGIIALLGAVMRPELAHAAACSVPSLSYPTIQSAIDDPTCDPINVAAGTYFEHLEIFDREVTIDGAGKTLTKIDGSASGRVVHIKSTLANDDPCPLEPPDNPECDMRVTLTDLRIQNGKTTGDTEASNGAGIWVEGPDDDGIIEPLVTLSNVDVINNHSSMHGGGIGAKESAQILTDVWIDHNSAQFAGGGVWSEASFDLTRTRVSFNDSFGPEGEECLSTADDNGCESEEPEAPDGDGEGFENLSKLEAVDSTFDHNTAHDDGGGGIHNGGKLDLMNCTIDHNKATDGAGIDNAKQMELVNVTIAHNTAFGSPRRDKAHEEGGGGINQEGAAQLAFVTIAKNKAPKGTGGGISSLLDEPEPRNQFTDIKNSIVSNNKGGNCRGTFNSLGHNLDSGITCEFHEILGDLIKTKPVLGKLKDNGGPTNTMALSKKSPAIDAVPVDVCTDASNGDVEDPDTSVPVEEDQRHVARPQGPACDIGAFELEQD